MKKIISALTFMHVPLKAACNERFNADLSTEFYHVAIYLL